MRLKKGLPSLRHQALAGLVFSVFRTARENLNTRLVQFSLQSNHLHLIVETAGKADLSRAMKGLAVRLARRLNERLRRRGGVFADRYHSRALRSPSEVRRVLVYVLRNHHRHATDRGRPVAFDAFSTAAYFDGFSTRISRWPRHGFVPPEDPPIAPAETWLLRVGWRRLGLIGAKETPARAPRR
jgi:REP element-mobilizing transposase RayT